MGDSAKSLQEIEFTKYRNMVITPRGLTIRILRRLFRESFKSILIESIESTYTALAKKREKMFESLMQYKH